MKKLLTTLLTLSCLTNGFTTEKTIKGYALDNGTAYVGGEIYVDNSKNKTIYINGSNKFEIAVSKNGKKMARISMVGGIAMMAEPNIACNEYIHLAENTPVEVYGRVTRNNSLFFCIKVTDEADPSIKGKIGFVKPYIAYTLK